MSAQPQRPRRRRPVRAAARGPARAARAVRTGCPCRSSKAKDFKGTMRRLGGLVKPERLRIGLVVALAVVSVAFAVIGPKILGNATNILFEGVVSKQIPAGVTQAQAVAGAAAPRAREAWPT